MRLANLTARWWGAGLAILAAFGCGQAAGPRTPATKPLALERLYSLPRLIGTAPRGFAWSRDSQTLTFLWNNEGTNFYDVWTATVASPTPVRVTRMPRTPPLPAGRGDVEAIERAVAAETDTGVQAVTWHPDGRRILLTFRGGLLLASSDTAPASLVPGSMRASEAAYAPDGSSLAFVSGGDLWTMPAAEPPAPPRRLTRLASEDVRIESYRWSPDGRRILFVEANERPVPKRGVPDYLAPETTMVAIVRPFPGEEPTRRRLGVIAVEGGEPRWLAIGDDRRDLIHAYRWSPNGRAALVDKSDIFAKDRRLLVVDAETGRAREIYREQDPHNVTTEWSAEWAPDGAGVYFTSDRDEDYHIYYVALAGGEPRRITQGDWAVSSFSVPAAARAVFFVGHEGRPEERHLYRVGLDGGPIARLSRRPGTHAPVISPDGRYAADYFSSDETPYDLLLTTLDRPTGDASDERQVIHSPLDEFEQYRWVKAQYVTFPSVADGVTLQGRLSVSSDLDRRRKHPAILGSVYSNTVRNQWGGRTAHPTWGLDQYLVQEGYVLLNVDIRGSSGHGKAFRQRLQFDYGGIDVEDLYSGAQYLKTLGFVDERRIGIWGSSYGGLLTCMSLFKKPGVYQAGVAGAPATNAWHATTGGEYRVMMAPQDHPDAYARMSAFTHAAGLQDHLMIIHGMRDRTVLFKDSVALVQRLMLLGKDVDFVIAPNSEHGWDTEGLYQTLFTFRKLVAHFERYLGKGPS